MRAVSLLVLAGLYCVNNHIPTVTEVGVRDDKIITTNLANGLLHQGDVVELCGQALVMADLL